MNIEENIKRLGGVESIYKDKETKLTVKDIIKIEEILQAKVPEDVALFLTTYGIVGFEKESICFRPYKEDAEYIHKEETGQPNFIFIEDSVSVFYGVDPEDGYDVMWSLSEDLRERRPDKMLPIGTDGMGNDILVSLQKHDYGKVYFWDHECEFDVDDYLEETGQVMPEEAKYQNLWLIGTSLEDFFDRLYYVPIEED
ncbi:SMI1/KNR4 family protein [Myroides sp. LJL116]